MSYTQDECKQIADVIRAAGFIVYLSYTGEYGFFTDEKEEVTVSFGNLRSGPRFYGCYEPTKSAGNGWGIADIYPLDVAKVKEVFKQAHYPPLWATKGAKVKLLTVARKLTIYDAASSFRKVEG